jgi:hypothetical protein
MPRIPTVNAEKTLSVGNQPEMPAGFGTAPGKAMQKLGSAIGSFGAAFEAGAEQEDPATELQNQIAIANHEGERARAWAEHQNTHVVGSDPTEGANNFSQTWAERDAVLYGKTIRPTTTARANQYKLNEVRSRNAMLLDVDKFKYKQVEEKVAGQVSKIISDNVSTLVGKGPEAIKQNIPVLMDQINAVISNPSLSPRIRERLLNEHKTLIYQAATDGLPPEERLAFWESFVKEQAARTKARETANPGGGAGSNNGEDVESDGSPKLLKGPTAANQNDKEPSYKGAFKFFESKVPSPGERRAIHAEGGIVVNLDTNWSKGNPTGPMIVIPDNASPAQREAAQAYVGELYNLNKEVFGRSLPPRVVTRSENGRGRAATIHTEPYAVTDAAAVKFFSTPEGQAKHAAILRNTLGKIPGVHFSIPHDPSKGDMGASGNGTNEVTLAKGVIAALQGGGDGSLTSGDESGTSQSAQARGVPTIRDAVAEIAIKDRSRLQAEHQLMISRKIKSLNDNAALGFSLPPDQLQSLKTTIEATKDPAMIAQYNAAVGLAQVTTGMKSQSVVQNEIFLNEFRAKMAKSQPGPGQLELLDKLESFVSTQRTELNSDKLKWSMRSGVVPATRLNIADPKSMADRLSAGEVTQQRFGGDLVLLTKDEADLIAEEIKGGKSIIAISAGLVESWGPENARRALGQINSKMPESAIAGWLITKGVNAQAAKDIDAAIKFRNDPSYKPNIPPVQKYEEDVRSVYDGAYNNFPPEQRASMIKAAQALYEVRAKGNPEYNSDIFKQALRDVTGERTDEKSGKKYGGAMKESNSWWTDKSIVIPTNWRQNSFRKALSGVTVEDLEAAGMKLPEIRSDPNGEYGVGKPITIEKLMNGRLVQIDDGKFLVSMVPRGTEMKPGQEGYVTAAAGDPNAADGRLFVLDLNKLEPILKKRAPTYFWQGQ